MKKTQMKITLIPILMLLMIAALPAVIAPGGMEVYNVYPEASGIIELEENFVFTLYPDNRANVSCDVVIDGSVADTEDFIISPITVNPINYSFFGPAEDYFSFPADYNTSFDWYVNCSYYTPAYGGSANSATRESQLPEEPPASPTGAVVGGGEAATEYLVTLFAMLLLIGLVMAVVPMKSLSDQMKKIVIGSALAFTIVIILVVIL